MEKYRESSLHLLFDKTKTTMPRGAPGTLSDSAYVDIVSYLLNVNEFPAGARELRLEDLPNIQLVGETALSRCPIFRWSAWLGVSSRILPTARGG